MNLDVIICLHLLPWQQKMSMLHFWPWYNCIHSINTFLPINATNPVHPVFWAGCHWLMKIQCLGKVVKSIQIRALFAQSVWFLLRWVYLRFRGHTDSLLGECCWTHKGTRRQTQSKYSNLEHRGCGWAFTESCFLDFRTHENTLNVLTYGSSQCGQYSLLLFSRFKRQKLMKPLQWCLQCSCSQNKSDMLVLCCLNGFLIQQTFWQQESAPAMHHCAPTPTPVLRQTHEHTHTHTVYYTCTSTTQSPKQATPPCTCPQPHVDTLAVKLLCFTWRYNWHKLLSRWYRSCCLRTSIPLLTSFLPHWHRNVETKKLPCVWS